ncbi:hypothetical protein BaRGS_00025104 [Batillaria attramentaria]|uniref:LIM zinc-binding domain-containing protein n=1 Tax=Batillaria attramentaria TaxID=370345 RepID=A0ABD0K976_9CAEN
MSRLSRSSSGAGHHSTPNPGATSVWVGSHPPQNGTNAHPLSHQMAALRFSNDDGRDLNSRPSGHKQHRSSVSSTSSDNLTSPGEGQYFVVSVRDSTSSAEGDSGYNGSANFSPTSPKAGYSSGAGNVQNHLGSLPSLKSPVGGDQYQLPPNYLQQSGIANMYSSTGILPSASSFGVLPQAVYSPQQLALQQSLASPTSLSPDFLAAALGQPALHEPQPLYSSLPYLGQPVDINALTAAMAASQPLLSPLQSPTSPVFMSPTFTSPLPTLPLSPPAYPTATAGVPFSQSSFHVNSPPPLLNGVHSQTPLAPGATPTTYGSPSADFSARKRSNISTGSLEQADDQTTSGVGSSVPSTPSDSSPTSPQSEHHDHHPLSTHATHVQTVGVEPCYDRPADKDACLRCGKKVYAMEKVGPVKDALYHKTCFTCAVCRTKLTLHNFHHSDADMADLHVYCHSHKPAARANPVDSSSVGIQRALTVPRLGRINDQIRGGPEASKHVHLDSNAVSIRSAMCAPAPTLQTSIKTREGAWFREQRKSETMPPEDVVKHDGKQKQYQGSRSLYIDT